jgi:hypothetical protein
MLPKLKLKELRLKRGTVSSAEAGSAETTTDPGSHEIWVRVPFSISSR